jgi:type IV secretory pathway VirB10-like protein
MRGLFGVILLSSLALAQASQGQNATHPSERKGADAPALTIPAGSKIPVALKHAISTKSARVGDSVYAETNFPFVLNEKVIVPAGTYVQGKISELRRPGRVHGRAELLIHFTTLIYPSGYTVMLPGAVENVPGADKTTMKGEEGTIQQDSRYRGHRSRDRRLESRRQRRGHRGWHRRRRGLSDCATVTRQRRSARTWHHD